MNQKTRIFFIFIIGAFSGILAMYLFNNNNNKNEKKNTEIELVSSSESKNSGKTESDIENSFDENSIDHLTNETVVINYVKANKKLPDYYITKNEARNLGWISSKGNLCEILPGKAIGGDKFSNRERTLPKNEQYYEADVNYRCGRRNADRIVFTKSGEIYLTKNHYKSFEKQ